jgi:hypothetical protein
MERKTISSEPLNQQDFYAMERAAVSYLFNVCLGTERFDDGRYKSALVLIGYLDKHHAPTTTPSKAPPATDGESTEVLYDEEVARVANGGPDAG